MQPTSDYFHGRYTPIIPHDPETVAAAIRQVVLCVPVVDVPDVMEMLGLVES